MAGAPDTRWEDFSRLHDEEVKACRPLIIVDEDCEVGYAGDSFEVQYDELLVESGEFVFRLTDLGAKSTTPTLRTSIRDEPVPCDIDMSFFQPSATQRLQLLHLPPEILERIFLHSGPNAFARLSKTCKILNRLAWDRQGLLWKRLLVHHFNVELPELLPRSTVTLLSEYKKRVCESKLDHFGENTFTDKGPGDVPLCAPCRKDWMEAQRKAARAEKLKGTLAKYGLEPHIDDPLCQEFIKERYFIHPERLLKFISEMLAKHIIHEHSIYEELIQAVQERAEADLTRKEQDWISKQVAFAKALRVPTLGEEELGLDAEDASLFVYRGTQKESFDRLMSRLACNSSKRRAPSQALKLFRRAIQRGGYPDDVKTCDCGRPFLKEYIIEHQHELEAGAPATGIA